MSFVGFSQGLESQMMSSNAFNNSVHPHLRDNEERFLDLKSEVLVKSLSLDLFSIFSIDHSPRLSLRVVLLRNYNVGSFFVFTSSNIENLHVLNIVEVSTQLVPLEKLEPA